MKEIQKQSKSGILRLLAVFTAWVYRCADKGFFGRLFNSYQKGNLKLKNSWISSIMGSNSRLGKFVRKIRFVIADQFETSGILLLWRKFMRFLIGCKLRLYGSFFITSGIYTALVYFLKKFVLESSTSDSSYILLALIFSLISLPLLMSGKTFAEAVSASSIGHFLVWDTFGIADEKLLSVKLKRGDNYNIAIIAGIIFGVLSYFISPLYLLAGIALVVFVALIMANPEIGVITTLILLPVFAGNDKIVYLSICVLLYSVSYLIKLIRGKRVLTLELTDVFLIFFSVLVLLSGYVTSGRSDYAIGSSSTSVLLILGCIIAGTLMRTKAWQNRCMAALKYSGLAVAIISIWQFAAMKVDEVWNIQIAMPGIGQSVFFENKDYLAMFLTVSLLVSLASKYRHNDVIKKQRFLDIVVSFIVALALSLTGSMLGVIGIFSAIMMFGLIMNSKTITWAIFVTVISTSVFIILDGVLGFDINLSTDTTYSMIQTWKGTFAMLKDTFFCGVGAGGFKELYPSYAVNGFESASDSRSFFLRIVCDTGIVGCLIVMAIIFLYMRNCFEFIRLRTTRDSKASIAAGLCAVVGIIIQSICCDIWDCRVLFYLIFAIIAIVGANSRTNRIELAKSELVYDNNEYSATIEL